MDLLKVISGNIQKLLDERKISISELSNYLNISRQTMTNYLKNTSVIDSLQLAKIAEFFGVSISELYKVSEENAPEMIFRTALNYNVAQKSIEQSVVDSINDYYSISRAINKGSFYLPEQYNLSIVYDDSVIDINYECQDYFDSKLKMDIGLRNCIQTIALEQRQLLGLGNSGAIGTISALNKRGINIIFQSIPDDISGLSVCDDIKGCYIIVNSNQNIERQLFTIAHEYAHIILHRPVYKRRVSQSISSKRKCFLDVMADCFAGYFLCPENLVSNYYDSIVQQKGNLQSLCKVLIPIKLNLNISLSALMMSLKSYGYISQYTVSEYFNILRANGKEKYELCPIANNSILHSYFNSERDKSIIEMLNQYYNLNQDTELVIEKLKHYTILDDNKINELISKWDKEIDGFNDIFEIEE